MDVERRLAMTMVDRFTSIIDAFDDTTVGLSLDQVAARAALPRSTTHRILDHLVRLNWLSRTERGYGLGKRAISWGAGDAADLRLREAAAPVLHDLQVCTGAVVHLGVLNGRHIVHVDKLGGPSVPTRVGTRTPAHELALGLAVLAAGPLEDVDSAIAAELHRIRRAGVACRRNDYGPGLSSVAATIDGRAAVGIVLPDSVSPDRYRPLVIAAASRIRKELSAG
jgi:DNA-binding IclR family transcriptional regulator